MCCRFLEDRPYALGRLTSDGLELYSAWHFELDRYVETNFVIIHRGLLAKIPTDRRIRPVQHGPSVPE